MRIALLILLLGVSGCMTSFDRRVVREHDDWLKFKEVHEAEFDCDAKRAGWYADFWWPVYLQDKELRGTAIEYPRRGEWATFSGQYTVKYIHDAKEAWKKQESQ